jgi:DNA-binding GntR family transcriptional regulator
MQSPFGPLLDAKTREQAAYEALRGAITAGRWGEGEPLVGSRIADELGVSRITVANALKRLAGEGFVRLTPHRGAEVAGLDASEVREVYLMRAELEALAAREAARWVTPGDLADIAALNAEIGRERDAGADIRTVRAVDRRFHRRIRAVARMPLLAQTLQNLADQCEGYRARLLDARPLVVPSPERHADLLAALAARDGPAVAERMREHLLGGMGALLANLEPRPDPALAAGLGEDERRAG